MINGNIIEFIDLLSYGEELVFTYKEQSYFIQGWWDKDGSHAAMVLTTVDETEFNGYLWECHRKTMKLCAEAFLSEPMWNGKTFIQIQDKVIWSDW